MAHREARNTRTHYRCRTCEGAGEVEVNVRDYGFGPDPQSGEPGPCPNPGCIGGWVRFVPVDALDVLAHERRQLRYATTRYFYNQARATAMKPVKLPPDEVANPLYRQAQADVAVACKVFAGLERAFAGMFGEPARAAA